MSQDIVDSLKLEFETLAKVKCRGDFLEKGDSHRPSTLSKNEKGVYVFSDGAYCFKVGKAGSKSKARWNSHHYNLDATTPSTFPKSIIKDIERFKRFFPADKHQEIEGLCRENIKEWIQNNTSRMEFIISGDESDYALNLLEALLQFRLMPEYEGKNA